MFSCPIGVFQPLLPSPPPPLHPAPALDGMLVYRRVTLDIKFAVTHLYTWVERRPGSVKGLAQEHNTMSPARARSWGPFLEGPERFSHPKSHSKISNLYELCYSHIRNINRGSVHPRSFRRVHLSVFKYRSTKMALRTRKGFRGLLRNSPLDRSIWKQTH